MKPNEAAKAIWDEIVANARKPTETELVEAGWMSAAEFARRTGLGNRHSLGILQKQFLKGEMDRVSGLADNGEGQFRVTNFYRPKALRPAETGASKAPGR